jgi:hypothetical protein
MESGEEAAAWLKDLQLQKVWRVEEQKLKVS